MQIDTQIDTHVDTDIDTHIDTHVDKIQTSIQSGSCLLATLDPPTLRLHVAETLPQMTAGLASSNACTRPPSRAPSLPPPEPARARWRNWPASKPAASAAACADDAAARDPRKRPGGSPTKESGCLNWTRGVLCACARAHVGKVSARARGQKCGGSTSPCSNLT